jgi:hypothetical protein
MRLGMKHINVLACAVGLFFVSTCMDLPAAGDGPNLAVNPDFESLGPGRIPSGWSTFQRASGAVFRVMTDAKLAHSGKTCVSIQQTAITPRNYAGWAQTIPAKASTIYRYSFWIKTDNVRPLTSHNDAPPTVAGNVGFLDTNRKNLPLPGHSVKSNSVLMTHDWNRFELSFKTPESAAFIKVNLNLGNAVGTVYFDTVSLVASSFRKLESPDWLADAIVYGAGPWEFAQFGDGKGLAGLRQKLPELKDLGVNMLYLLPIWENRGWYGIADHYAIFRAYGTESDLKALVADAHGLGIRVILDLVTIGVAAQSRLVSEHRDWFILSPDNELYHSWMEMLGLDPNLPAVQDYYAEVARYYMERAGIDGYRCDAAAASPYHLFAKIRTAIQKVKPDAIMLAEESAPVDYETAFDTTYDFEFCRLVPEIMKDPKSAGQGIRDLEHARNLFPPGALQFRFLEFPGLDYTVASPSCGTDCALAFGALLLTVDGIPKINHGQEVGNMEPQKGQWVPALKWDANPDAARYRATYKTLAGIRARFPVMRRGDLRALKSSDESIATFARILPEEQPIITAISFSNAPVDLKLDLSAILSQVKGRFTLVDLLSRDNAQFTVSDPKAFTLKLEPYKARILLVSPDGR